MLTQLAANEWTLEAAAHFLNRAAFGGSPEEIQKLHAMGHAAAVRSLLHAGEDEDLFPAPEIDPMRIQRPRGDSMTPEEVAERRKIIKVQTRERTQETRIWWIQRMASTPYPAREKCVLFWHGHWATSIQKVNDPFLVLQQNQTLRAHAFGPFAPFAKEMSKDPAMIRYLDLNSSKVGHPNENFARELMELFTLGEGHYSEVDIQEAARAFTGYRINPETGGFLFSRKNHDAGAKKIFGKSGAFDGDATVDLIVSRPQCAEFLSAKIWNFYVGEKPAGPLNQVLASEYRASGMQTGNFLERIFLSREFYSSKYRRRQIKSPVQWLIQSCKNLERPMPNPKMVQNSLEQLGQVLFAPPNVKGWDGGRAWISSSSLLLRYNLADTLVRGGGDAAPDMEKILPAGTKPPQACDLLAWRLFQAPLNPALREKTLHLLEKNGNSEAARRDIVHLLMSTPEFQLT
jgi:uncharacterized protein (DUF1800 family)